MHEHQDEHYEARFIPDPFIETLKSELKEFEEKKLKAMEEKDAKELAKKKWSPCSKSNKISKLIDVIGFIFALKKTILMSPKRSIHVVQCNIPNFTTSKGLVYLYLKRILVHNFKHWKWKALLCQHTTPESKKSADFVY